jgi:Mrp family chromosome partitioning ATPase
MIDILRTADRRPGPEPTPADEPAEAIEPAGPEPDEEVSAVAPDAEPEPPIEDDDEVPFIEVGGPREPALRLVPAPQPALAVAGVCDPGPASQGPATEDPVRPLLRPTEESPGLFTIRFQPVHAARLGGRGPAAEVIAFHQPDHPISVQYRSLAAEIARQLPGSLPRVLLFTGAAGGVGTSTVVLNLAVTLARQDARVTVADAHLSRPALAARLGLPAGPGLREVLAGQMPPAWCVQETAQPNLLVLPAGAAGVPREGAELGAILELLRDRSDCVLLDAGPWGEAAAADLAGGCDAVYLVMRQEAAATPATAELQEEILQQTGRLRGCVLTQR